MKKQFVTKKLLNEELIKKEKAIIESFAKNFNKIKRIDEAEINEELYDIISDIKRNCGGNVTLDCAEMTVGRNLTSDEKAALGLSDTASPLGAYSSAPPSDDYEAFMKNRNVYYRKKGEPQDVNIIKQERMGMTDALIDSGVFTKKASEDFPDTWSGIGGYSNVKNVLMQGVADGKWSEENAMKFLKDVDSTWD